MEKYKEYKGVYFYTTDRGYITIKWTRSFESKDNMSKTFLNEDYAIKYIDDNGIFDFINNVKTIDRKIFKEMGKQMKRKK